MFGLMRKSEHERICRNLHSHINYYAEGNRKHCDEIQNMKKQLELENRRATYWKMKFLEPDKEPIILGSKEDIEYIKAWVFYCFVDNNRTENRAVYILGYEQIEVRPMAVKDAEHQLNLEISENEARKDFSKAERIESLKAENRKSATQFGGGGNISTTVGITKDVVKLEDRQKKLEKELRN